MSKKRLIYEIKPCHIPAYLLSHNVDDPLYSILFYASTVFCTDEFLNDPDYYVRFDFPCTLFEVGYLSDTHWSLKGGIIKRLCPVYDVDISHIEGSFSSEFSC